MKSVNKVMLVGNVIRDAELKATPTGRSVCAIGLATNRVWKDSSGNRQSLPEYHNLVAWGGLADFAGQYVKKGKPLYVEGYLKTRNWEGKKGDKMYRTEVVLDNIVLLGTRSASEETASAEVADAPAEEEVTDEEAAAVAA